MSHRAGSNRLTRVLRAAMTEPKRPRYIARRIADHWYVKHTTDARVDVGPFVDRQAAQEAAAHYNQQPVKGYRRAGAYEGIRPGTLTRARKPTERMTPDRRRFQITLAIACLKDARDHLRDVAPLTAAKVRRALKSAEGAARHADGSAAMRRAGIE